MLLSALGRRSSVLLLAAAALLHVSVAAQEPSPQPLPVFRSAVDVVSIQASVRDRRGRPIGGLTASDFDVLDNGVSKPILSVRFDRESPVSVAIVVDMSGSMRLSSKVSMARHAFASVLTQLRNGVDEVAVFSFDSALHERRSFTRDVDQLRNALDEFDAFGTTSLHDAAAGAARKLAERAAAHKAIVVLTDGIDTSSSMSARDVSALASSIDVPIYIVATIPSIDQRIMLESSARSTAAADLRDLAEWTGGQFVFASTPVETEAVGSNVIGELRQQYVLAIEAGEAPEWRRLDVRVKRPAASVRARSGYFGG
jgi:Ca-activated chloride channel homolog